MSIGTILRVLLQAVAAWWTENRVRLGASVAYYTLFSIAPILIVATAVAAMIFGPEAVRGEVVGEIDALVGTEGGKAVQALLQGASRREESLVAAAAGSVAFVLAACGAFLELQTALNTIWRVEPRPGNAIKEFLVDRLRSFGLVVATGFLLMVSLAASAILAAFSKWLPFRRPTVQSGPSWSSCCGYITRHRSC
jgi:membrane protein